MRAVRGILCAACLAAAGSACAQQPAAVTPPPRPQLASLTQFSRYAADNEKLGPPRDGEQRVVFLGDSITDSWGRDRGSFFPGKPYVNRGISGQTTAQMLLRFEADVVHLQPTVVVILAGINDIAENTGPYTDAQIEDNFRAMVAIAKQNWILVVVASILPASRVPWHPGIVPTPRIASINAWLRKFAEDERLVYLDYFSALALPDGAMRPELADDRYVHPNAAGYAVMQPLAEAAVSRALAQRPPPRMR